MCILLMFIEDVNIIGWGGPLPILKHEMAGGSNPFKKSPSQITKTSFAVKKGLRQTESWESGPPIMGGIKHLKRPDVTVLRSLKRYSGRPAEDIQLNQFSQSHFNFRTLIYYIRVIAKSYQNVFFKWTMHGVIFVNKHVISHVIFNTHWELHTNIGRACTWGVWI